MYYLEKDDVTAETMRQITSLRVDVRREYIEGYMICSIRFFTDYMMSVIVVVVVTVEVIEHECYLTFGKACQYFHNELADS